MTKVGKAGSAVLLQHTPLLLGSDVVTLFAPPLHPVPRSVAQASVPFAHYQGLKSPIPFGVMGSGAGMGPIPANET